MIQSLVSLLTGKKIVLLGFGREGQSTLNFLLKHVSDVQIQIMDRNADYASEKLDEFQTSRSIDVYGSDDYLQFDNDVDLVFKSPGIPLKQLEGRVEGYKITSQSQLFIKTYRERIIGITGTKGKSTTCTFLYQLMKGAGISVELVGNIGKPAFDYIVPDSIPDYYVYELSSHQLETVNVSPKIGIILNLFEEHLDHYYSYEHYAAAKLNIARYQSEDDFFIYSALTDELPNRIDESFRGQQIIIQSLEPLVSIVEMIEDASHEPKPIMSSEETVWVHNNKVSTHHKGLKYSYEYNDSQALKGIHNLLNMVVALKVTQLLDLDLNSDFEELRMSFTGLPHRLAYVATVHGVDYYNDSISTIPQATIAAVTALKNVQTIIIGGMDRGIDYSSLIEFINREIVLSVILLPDTGHKIESELNNSKRLYHVESMEEAVSCAAKITREGHGCLLSPAAPSYGYYKNFEERGEIFEGLVKDLK